MNAKEFASKAKEGLIFINPTTMSLSIVYDISDGTIFATNLSNYFKGEIPSFSRSRYNIADMASGGAGSKATFAIPSNYEIIKIIFGDK